MLDEFSSISPKLKQQHFNQLTDYIEKLRHEPELRELFIEMTINCNEHCVHCGSNCGDIKSQNALSDKEILRMLVKLRNDLAEAKKPLPFLSITGGEPLVRPNLLDLMEKIHYLGYQWGMTTNGTLVTPDIAHGLKSAGMYSTSVSIDGLKDTHEWFRQTPECFDATLNGIDSLVSEGFNSIMVTTVVHKKNISELEAIYRLLKSHKIKEWRLTNIEPIGRANNNSSLALDPDDYKYMMDFIVTHQPDPDMRLLFTCNHYVGLNLEHEIRPWYFFCRAGLQVAAVQYDGKIGACLDIERRDDLIYGNIRTHRILDCWENGYQIFREHKEEKSEKCSICNHKHNCMGSGFHTWDVDNNEPRICMMEMLGIK